VETITHVVQRAEARVLPEIRAEVGRDRFRVAAQKDAEDDQPEQRRYLCRGKHVLDQRAGADAKYIDDRQQDHDKNGSQVLGVEADIHIAQHHGTDVNRRHLPEMQNPVAGGYSRPEDSQKFTKSHAHSRDRPGLDHEKERPAIKKSP